MPSPVTYWTQPITTRIVRPCLEEDDTSIYLRWLSPLNFWEGWLFTGDVDDKVALDGATSFTPGYERELVPLQRPGVETLTIRSGNLSRQQHRGLTTLLEAPAVYRQYPGGRLERVFVTQNATASRTSSEGRHELALDIELKRRNSITN